MKLQSVSLESIAELDLILRLSTNLITVTVKNSQLKDQASIQLKEETSNVLFLV